MDGPKIGKRIAPPPPPQDSVAGSKQEIAEFTNIFLGQRSAFRCVDIPRASLNQKHSDGNVHHRLWMDSGLIKTPKATGGSPKFLYFLCEIIPRNPDGSLAESKVLKFRFGCKVLTGRSFRNELSFRESVRGNAVFCTSGPLKASQFTSPSSSAATKKSEIPKSPGSEGRSSESLFGLASISLVVSETQLGDRPPTAEHVLVQTDLSPAVSFHPMLAVCSQKTYTFEIFAEIPKHCKALPEFRFREIHFASGSVEYEGFPTLGNTLKVPLARSVFGKRKVLNPTGRKRTKKKKKVTQMPRRSDKQQLNMLQQFASSTAAAAASSPVSHDSHGTSRRNEEEEEEDDDEFPLHLMTAEEMTNPFYLQALRELSKAPPAGMIDPSIGAGAENAASLFMGFQSPTLQNGYHSSYPFTATTSYPAGAGEEEGTTGRASVTRPRRSKQTKKRKKRRNSSSCGSDDSRPSRKSGGKCSRRSSRKNLRDRRDSDPSNLSDTSNVSVSSTSSTKRKKKKKKRKHHRHYEEEEYERSHGTEMEILEEQELDRQLELEDLESLRRERLELQQTKLDMGLEIQASIQNLQDMQDFQNLNSSSLPLEDYGRAETGMLGMESDVEHQDRIVSHLQRRLSGIFLEPPESTPTNPTPGHRSISLSAPPSPPGGHSHSHHPQNVLSTDFPDPPELTWFRPLEIVGNSIFPGNPTPTNASSSISPDGFVEPQQRRPSLRKNSMSISSSPHHHHQQYRPRRHSMVSNSSNHSMNSNHSNNFHGYFHSPPPTSAAGGVGGMPSYPSSRRNSLIFTESSSNSGMSNPSSSSAASSSGSGGGGGGSGMYLPPSPISSDAFHHHQHLRNHSSIGQRRTSNTNVGGSAEANDWMWPPTSSSSSTNGSPENPIFHRQQTFGLPSVTPFPSMSDSETEDVMPVDPLNEDAIEYRWERELMASKSSVAPASLWFGGPLLSNGFGFSPKG